MITDVTSKVDLPGTANRGSEQTDTAEKYPHAAGTQSDSDIAGTVPPTRDRLEQAVGKVREVLQKADSRLRIEIDHELQRVVVKVMNGDSSEVIRQIPPKEVLELERQLSKQKGVLLEEQA